MLLKQQTSVKKLSAMCLARRIARHQDRSGDFSLSAWIWGVAIISHHINQILLFKQAPMNILGKLKNKSLPLAEVNQYPFPRSPFIRLTPFIVPILVAPADHFLKI